MYFFKAKPIADRIVELLSPHCDLIHIAGSVRREKYDVKDIEVCCIPKETFISTDLFGGGENIRVLEFKTAIDLFSQQIVKGNIATGRYVQLILKGCNDLKLDLFMPEKDDYYRQFAIRTGSSDYSHKIIAGAWIRKGWVGSDQGLRQMKDCVQQQDKGWKCIFSSGTRPPVWQSEEEFFDWVNLPWILPRLRNM